MAVNKNVLEVVREGDFVEYFIFPSILDNDICDKNDFLKCQLSEVNSVIKKYGSNYIWQKDEINLIVNNKTEGFPSIQNNDEESLPPHLYGITHYGDNIEDEWFIVYLLIQVTKEVPELVVRVIDADGEFLLIEAADFLPRWANPEICSKRVYLYKGEIHIIQKQSSNECEEITIEEALAAIHLQPELTKATTNIQKAIYDRIQGYPEKVMENLHHSNIYVPVAVAALLKERPSLIAPAVTAFCDRDPIDTRVCRAMRYFPPETRVMTRATFTKCLYAMLTHQKYVPDKRTGWNLPPPTSSCYKEHSIGMKLACGFEILVSHNKSSKTDDNDLSLDPAWFSYKKSLSEKGYFKGLLEGSKEYSRLEELAKVYYKEHVTVYQPPKGKIILDLLKNIEYEELKQSENVLPPSDDDSWLEVSPDELERLMEQRYGCKTSVNSSHISSHISNFFNHISSLEGAEFPNSEQGESSTPPIRPKRGIKLKKSVSPVEEKDKEDDSKVSLDQEAFSCAVQNILDFVVPEDSWDESEGSGMSSYEDEDEMDLDNQKEGLKETPVSELKQYMDQMDKELSSTTMGKSFEKVKKKGMEDSFSDIESFEPVDIDMNALKNILASYQAQMGGAGPASNMLGPMGLKLDEPL
uniref:Uncharacterized protein n=1 Tax=Clastoptera arizonana TaxID=38151 RepID=A0A1B6D498_9HEMI